MSADNGGGFVTRLRAKLNKGDSWLTYDLANLLPGQGLDDDALEELETRLLTSDVGVEATMAIVDHLRAEANAGRIRNAEALRKAIANVMGGLLEPVSQPLDIPEFIRPYIILMVGVNGAGSQHHRFAFLLQAPRQLPDSGGLAGAVHPDHQDDVRPDELGDVQRL